MIIKTILSGSGMLILFIKRGNTYAGTLYASFVAALCSVSGSEGNGVAAEG